MSKAISDLSQERDLNLDIYLKEHKKSETPLSYKSFELLKELNEVLKPDNLKTD